jgi:hypothetical protein
MKKLSIKRCEEAKGLLEASRVAQAEFWRALSDLESCLGIEIVSTIDLQDASIEDLLDPARKRAILGIRAGIHSH